LSGGTEKKTWLVLTLLRRRRGHPENKEVDKREARKRGHENLRGGGNYVDTSEGENKKPGIGEKTRKKREPKRPVNTASVPERRKDLPWLLLKKSQAPAYAECQEKTRTQRHHQTGRDDRLGRQKPAKK